MSISAVLRLCKRMGFVSERTTWQSSLKQIDKYKFWMKIGYNFKTNWFCLKKIMGKIMPFYQRERTISLSGRSNQVAADWIYEIWILKKFYVMYLIK